jgi:hypothetical protein
MQPHEYSTESSLPIILASSSPDSKQPPEPEKVLFSPREPKKQDRLIRCKHREKMLQSSNERIQKHSAKEGYRQMLQRSEEALKVQEAFLQRQARKENGPKGPSSKSRSNHATRQRRSRYSKRRRPKLGLIQEAGGAKESSEEIMEAVRMLQRRRGRAVDKFLVKRPHGNRVEEGRGGGRGAVGRWVTG